MKEIKKVIISGGGTGGHIFPAIAIANELKRQMPNIDILFVGAQGRMEMEKVPQAGYRIKALPIAGFQRQKPLANFSLPFKIIKSLLIARNIINDFQPDLVIGVGGYASGPTLKMANLLKIPTVLQEQNSYPGKTNKLLAKKASLICVAYEGLERFFPKDKIVITGNPVRSDVVQIDGKRAQAFEHFALDENKKVVLAIGGSLGARTINDSMDGILVELASRNIQVIWQCGKFYADELEQKWRQKLPEGVWLNPFIFDMDYAYAAADIIISRAGAISVSELCIVGKPTILVPSPHVAEDHQTKNALALVQKNACVLITDNEAHKVLLNEIQTLLSNDAKSKSLSENIKKLGLPNASKTIVNEIIKTIS
jgi:UDP-N-acetylglucosamine--N-acetylmuramyl-(pentapeptide) pyrophosphoryl-undecaprenol N-acetylglucosamine transferase